MLGFSAIADSPIADIREDQYLVLTSQTLSLSLSSVALTTTVNAALASQSLVTTLNSLTIQAAANYALQNQNLDTTLNPVSAAGSATAALTSVSASTTLNSVSFSTSNVLGVTGLSLTGLVSPVLWSTDTVLSVTGFPITATLNSFRSFWLNIPTTQIPDIPYDDASIASTPICYTPPEPTMDPSVQGNWYDIGYNVPASLWAPITTTQTSNWTNIST